MCLNVTLYAHCLSLSLSLNRSQLTVATFDLVLSTIGAIASVVLPRMAILVGVKNMRL